MAYNPFKKPLVEAIRSLNVDDLNELISNQVAEGYHIEYKSTFVDPKKIAHSIASFANTYGGWYFVGITPGINNTPAGLAGFELAQFPDPIGKVHDVARQGMNPMPLV